MKLPIDMCKGMKLLNTAVVDDKSIECGASMHVGLGLGPGVYKV
jgi:hypothetical protein